MLTGGCVTQDAFVDFWQQRRALAASSAGYPKVEFPHKTVKRIAQQGLFQEGPKFTSGPMDMSDNAVDMLARVAELLVEVGNTQHFYR